MDFDLDDDHRLLAEQVRTFAFKEVAKGAAQRDVEASMPDELRAQLAALGLFGIAIPEEFGGAGLGAVASSIVVAAILCMVSMLTSRDNSSMACGLSSLTTVLAS